MSLWDILIPIFGFIALFLVAKFIIVVTMPKQYNFIRDKITGKDSSPKSRQPIEPTDEPSTEPTDEPSTEPTDEL